MVGKKTMLFVDAQNLLHGAKNYYDHKNLKIDIIKLKEKLSEDRDLIRSYWFDSYEPGNKGEKDSFFTFLETNGFRVEAKPLRERNGTYVEKGADIGLATEMIARGFNDSYEVAIVVTGDDDFNRAIRYVQDQGKIVNIACFESTMSSNLKRAADDFISLDEFVPAIEKE